MATMQEFYEMADKLALELCADKHDTACAMPCQQCQDRAASALLGEAFRQSCQKHP